MKRIYAFALISLLFFSCGETRNGINSKGQQTDKKVQVLKLFIKIKSPIKDAEFQLYDVNHNGNSIPGASDKNYKIILFVEPKDVSLWMNDKKNLITSYPHSLKWLKEIVDEKNYLVLTGYGYSTYYLKENGAEMIYWVNEEKGIIIIRYVQN